MLHSAITAKWEAMNSGINAEANPTLVNNAN
jgi:hypothetical protein